MTRFLISFDIDGTLELGDPPGPITLEMVHRARELGFIIGSCSDRTATSQRAIWKQIELEADFISLKHMLDEVRERFDVERYLHIGDRDLDKQFAEQAGFEFLWEHEAHTEPWLSWLE
jgi:phosphoglycolate phosphatase-like HAD superfamily hydrolase